MIDFIKEELRIADESMSLLLIQQLGLLDASAAPILRDLIEHSDNMTIVKAASKALIKVLT